MNTAQEFPLALHRKNLNRTQSRRLPDCRWVFLIGRNIKDLEVFHVEDNLHLFTHLKAGARINPGYKLGRTAEQVKEDFISHQLGHIHLGFNRRGFNSWRSKQWVVDILRSDAEDHFTVNVWLVNRSTIFGDLYYEVTGIDIKGGTILADLGREKVHCWRSNETRHKKVARVIIQMLWCIQLL